VKFILTDGSKENLGLWRLKGPMGDWDSSLGFVTWNWLDGFSPFGEDLVGYSIKRFWLEINGFAEFDPFFDSQSSKWFSHYSVSGKVFVDGAPVPEPVTMILLGSGLLGIAVFRKRFNHLQQ
jgi:hypothetical protein